MIAQMCLESSGLYCFYVFWLLSDREFHHARHAQYQLRIDALFEKVNLIFLGCSFFNYDRDWETIQTA